MPSGQDTAKRALVKLLRDLAAAFTCDVDVTRDSSEQEVNRAFRRVARKVHLDKPGGSQEDFQKLSAAHDAWTDLLKNRAAPGRPPRGVPRRLARNFDAVLVLCLSAKGSQWGH